VYDGFTPLHRGGSGPPLLLIHGFTDTWRTWELVLERLECSFEVLAPTLPGHAGAPGAAGLDAETLVGHLEALLDDAGWSTAHVAGNSLGGWLALQLAARSRAETVVALAPGGGWAPGDDAFAQTLAPYFRSMREQVTAAAPHIDALVESPEGRRLATAQVTCHFEHIPAELIAHQLRGVVGCDGGDELIVAALADGWELDAASIACPVRVVWGAEDRILPWPTAARRFREEWLPHADWVLLDGVGHLPQLDVPLETAELIAGFASR